MKYLTKSRFKLGLEYPNKLYYTRKKEYPNKKNEDPFLLALAEGGFQVEELARMHFPNGVLMAITRCMENCYIQLLNLYFLVAAASSSSQRFTASRMVSLFNFIGINFCVFLFLVFQIRCLDQFYLQFAFLKAIVIICW